MTVKQLYDWAKKNGKEDCELLYEDNWELPMIVAYESTHDNIVGLLADSGLDNYYGKCFDGKKDFYFYDGKKITEEEYNKLNAEDDDDI